MSQSSYPTASDLSTLLADEGITAPSSTRLNMAISTAVREWETKTGRIPFLAPSTTSTGTYSASSSPVSITVGSSAGFAVGQHAVIDTGSLQETQGVTAIPDSTHVTVAALTNSHNGSSTAFAVVPTSTRYYDPPGAIPRHPQFLSLRGGGKVLELDNGLISIVSLSVMTTQYTLGVPGNTSGVGMYWLQPQQNPQKGFPYEYIEFWCPVLGSPQSVIIEGVWGFSTVLPDDAWNAILGRAMMHLVPTVSAKIGKGEARRIEGEVSVDYSRGRDAGMFAYERGIWEEQWKSALNTYRRLTLGI